MESEWKYDEKTEQPYSIKHPLRRVYGLCRPLRRTFYPHFRFAHHQLATTKVAADKKKKTTKKRRGRKNGRNFDDQVTDKIQKRPNDSKEHPDLPKYFRLLTKYGYVSLYAQVEVGSMSLARRPISTRIDVVCPLKNNEYVLIENKYRQSEGYEVADLKQPKMQPPFDFLPNSPYAHDQLQLAFSKSLFEHTFPDVLVVGAMVIRVHHDGIAHYKLLPALTRIRHRDWDCLLVG
jgi:hypothetical protein